MKIMYFLTAIFENKFGKADKYYDEKGWHWMLSSDKPLLFESFEKAKEFSFKIEDTPSSDINIKEINIYYDLWEHKIPDSDPFIPKNVLFEKEMTNGYIFLSLTKQKNNAKKVLGLYRVSKNPDTWIYGKEQNVEILEKIIPDELIYTSYKYLEKAKEILIESASNKGELLKIEGVMNFVKRLDPKLEEYNFHIEYDHINSVEECIIKSYSLLLDTKKIMIEHNFPKQELLKIEGVMNFVKKLI